VDDYLRREFHAMLGANAFGLSAGATSIFAASTPFAPRV
jgi:hypothetical protein